MLLGEWLWIIKEQFHTSAETISAFTNKMVIENSFALAWTQFCIRRCHRFISRMVSHLCRSRIVSHLHGHICAFVDRCHRLYREWFHTWANTFLHSRILWVYIEDAFTLRADTFFAFTNVCFDHFLVVYYLFLLQVLSSF